MSQQQETKPEYHILSVQITVKDTDSSKVLDFSEALQELMRTSQILVSTFTVNYNNPKDR